MLQLGTLLFSQEKMICSNNIYVSLSFLADYFREGNSDAEDSELRFATCQSLWKHVKLEAEVSLAPNTKAFTTVLLALFLEVSFYTLKRTIC